MIGQGINNAYLMIKSMAQVAQGLTGGGGGGNNPPPPGANFRVTSELEIRVTADGDSRIWV